MWSDVCCQCGVLYAGGIYKIIGQYHYSDYFAAVYDSAGMSADLTNVTLALRTLGTFNFEGHTLTKLLKHCADNFLASDNEEVRMEAVKTCCSILSHTSLVCR